jgi:hypothetical protein
MTLKDCRKALEVQNQLKQYEAVKQNNSCRNSVSTNGIKTGRGTEELTFSIPWSYVLGIIDEHIDNCHKFLKQLGILEEPNEAQIAAGFDTPEKLAAASPEDLAAIKQ